ncbi:hypothetical protein ACLOJK_011254 [Asimina triloba]
MAAAQQLPASLRAALTYSIGVLALRRPFLHKVLDYEDEFFTLLMMVLETHSLRTTVTCLKKLLLDIAQFPVIDLYISLLSDASFSESLYGLRRRTVKISARKDTPKADSGDRLHYSGLERRQKVLSVAFLINNAAEAPFASLWGNVDATLDDTNYFMDEREISNVPVEPSGLEVSRSTRIGKRVEAVVAACYPWIHATNEGLSFAYQLLYLLDATGFYTPGLHVLGVHVCRATGQELMDSSSRIQRIRSRERERLRGPPWLKTLQRVLISCVYTTLDYAQTGLIAAVFFFKMMEWWYQSAEERMSAPTVYPPPPPPPPPKVAIEGIPLPPDRTVCPLCSQKRTNPSVLAVSGFVFCYACVFKYVSQDQSYFRFNSLQVLKRLRSGGLKG